MLFDLLRECDIIQEHAKNGRIGFGINHVMVGPINKTLDLVMTIVPANRAAANRRTFAELADAYKLPLDRAESDALAALPVIYEDVSDKDISEVAIALEAKACMTEHGKSMPRLHAEILATGYLARKATPACITVSYTIVNGAETFVSPGNSNKVNRHAVPEDLKRVVEMLGSAIPLARNGDQYGYDVLGISAIYCRNDDTPVVEISDPPAPQSTDPYHYERMIRSICSEYRKRFRI